VPRITSVRPPGAAAAWAPMPCDRTSVPRPSQSRE
jgi:hypothetical protein